MHYGVGKVVDKLLIIITRTCGPIYKLIKIQRSWSKSLGSPFLGLFHAISVVFYWF